MEEQVRNEMIKRIENSKIGLSIIGDIQVMNQNCNGVGILLDDEPILVIGSWDLDSCRSVVNELISSNAFKNLLNGVLGLKIHDFDKELRVVKFPYSNITQKNVMTLMIKNDQTGQVTDPRIQASPIVGFALSSKHYSDKRMAISLCIVPELENVLFKLKDTIGMKIDT